MLTRIANHNSAITNPLPRFVITLRADDATNGVIRVPLAITGQWVRGATTFTITREDLEAIARNFRERQNGEINVDYDHASEMPEVAAGGPVPSAGRIVRLDPPEAVGAQHAAPLRGDRHILYGWYEPTARARELLENREYRFISPAIEWNAPSKRTGRGQGTTLTSVALTNRPFLEELPQIRLSDPGFQLVGEPSGLPRQGRTLPYQSGGKPPHSKGGVMKNVSLSADGGHIKLVHEDFEDEYYLNPDDLRSCLGEAGFLATEAGPAATIPYAQARALLSEADAHGKFIPAAEVFRAQADQELEAAVRAGRILPRQRDDWRKIALSDLPTFRKLMSAQKPVVPLAPVGLAGTPPGDVQAQVKFLAEQRMRERQITFGQALSDLGREQPDLVQQYRRAVSGNE